METPLPEYECILTGHFHSGPDYQGHRSKGSPDWLLIYTLRGEGRIERNHQSIFCRPGDLHLCRPNTPHDYCTSPRNPSWEIIWAHFHPKVEWLDWMQWTEALPGWHHIHLRKPEAARITKCLLEMHRRASRLARDEHSGPLCLNALEEVLLWADSAHQSTKRPTDERTRLAIHFLCENHHRPLTLKRLALASGQSVARLTREFRRETRMSVQTYLENFRLGRARQLLARTTLSIKEIALQTGFQSPFYFSQRFKRKQQKSPRGYRLWALDRTAIRHKNKP